MWLPAPVNEINEFFRYFQLRNRNMEDNSVKKSHEQNESGQYQDILTQIEPTDRILDISPENSVDLFYVLIPLRF